MSAIKAFEKANRFVYGHIRKVAVVAADGGGGEVAEAGVGGGAGGKEVFE
jgi:hypothetical protein